jgi:hypothetical protein
MKKNKMSSWMGRGLVLCFVVGLLSACVDNNYNFDNLDSTIQVETQLVAPLVHSKLQLDDLLADSLSGLQLQIEGNELFIVHRDSQYMGNDLINQLKVLPKGTYDFALMVGEDLPIEITAGDVEYDVSFDFGEINTNPNERLDSILLGECEAMLRIHTKKLLPMDGSFLDIAFKPEELLLDTLKYPGNKIRIPMVPGEADSEAILDLTKAKLYFNGGSTFHAHLRGHLISEIPFQSGTEIDLIIDLEHLLPHVTYLHIGTERDIYEGEKEIDFNYTEDFQQIDAFFPFYDPQILMSCINNIGVPVRYYIDYVEAMDTRTGEKVRADFGGENPDTMSIVVNTPSFDEIKDLSDYELLHYDVRNLTRYSQVLFDRAFGHTDRLFKINPNKLRYHYRIRSIDNNPDNVHFFFHNSDMKLAEEAKMQLWFEGDATNPDKNFHITLTDSVLFLDEPADLSAVNLTDDTECVLKLSYKNSLPIGLEGKIAYLDANDQPILQDAEQSFQILAGKVDQEGYVVDTTDEVNAIRIAFVYEQAKTLLTEVKTLLLTYKLENDEYKTIKLRTNDWLELKANLYFNGSLVLNLKEMEGE